VEGVAIPAVYVSELRIANTDGVLQHGLKYRLGIAGITADDPEHL
jgi:hypothetical protein